MTANTLGPLLVDWVERDQDLRMSTCDLPCRPIPQQSDGRADGAGLVLLVVWSNLDIDLRPMQEFLECQHLTGRPTAVGTLDTVQGQITRFGSIGQPRLQLATRDLSASGQVKAKAISPDTDI